MKSIFQACASIENFDFTGSGEITEVHGDPTWATSGGKEMIAEIFELMSKT